MKKNNKPANKNNNNNNQNNKKKPKKDNNLEPANNPPDKKNTPSENPESESENIPIEESENTQNNNTEFETEDQASDQDSDQASDQDEDPENIPEEEPAEEPEPEPAEEPVEGGASEEPKDEKTEAEPGSDTESCLFKFAQADESDEEQEITFDDDDVQEQNTVVPTDKRITKPFLTKYERVRILGDRVQQLTLAAKPLVKNTENLTPMEIALLELENNLIPLIIERPLPNGKRERWYLKELAK